ncbi:DUF6639 family protein [Bradyrhizobium liaoningense]
MSSQSNKVVAHVPHRFKSGCLAAFRNRLSLRWIRRYALGLGAFGVGLLVGTSAAYADCSRERVTVIGDPDERDRACVALSDVSDYFARAGFQIQFDLTVRFVTQIEVSDLSSVHHDPVSGYYRATNNEIRILHANAPGTSERRPWHLSWDQEIGFSILEHEVVHAAIAHIMGNNYSRLPHAWHEALAYAVQISLMKPELRAQVLANFSAVQAFGSTLEINDVIYAFDPDAFAVAAYKFHVRNSDTEFLKRAINLKFELSDPTEF